MLVLVLVPAAVVKLAGDPAPSGPGIVQFFFSSIIVHTIMRDVKRLGNDISIRKIRQCVYVWRLAERSLEMQPGWTLNQATIIYLDVRVGSSIESCLGTLLEHF